MEPHRDRASTPETFEEWVTIRFGRRLYDAFFRSYTEKVWGIPGSEIRVAVGGAADQGLLALARRVLSILGLQPQATSRR